MTSDRKWYWVCRVIRFSLVLFTLAVVTFGSVVVQHRAPILFEVYKANVEVRK